MASREREMVREIREICGPFDHHGHVVSDIQKAMTPTPPYQKPVMGRLPKWQNAYIASRFGGDGVCMSPATGELMAELIDTGKRPLRARQ